MNTFKLKIVASDKVFFDGDCRQLVLPIADDGLYGFLANHENMVAPVEFGEMKITDADGKVIDAFIGDGFIEFFDNVANVVCISAELPENIDKRRAQRLKREPRKSSDKSSRFTNTISQWQTFQEPWSA